MHEELELKLAVTPDDLKRLGQDPLIRSLALKPASNKQLHSTYFDTPSHDLRSRGMALRVRHIAKRRVQTLKVPAGGASGLQHYLEYEADVDADTPDIARIEDKALRRLFDSEGLTGNLKPVFTTAFRRRSVPLKLEDSEVELALDSGEIAADGKSLPICEAELELVSGPSRHIYALALALHKRFKFRLETRTKSARGYHLTADLGPHPQKARALDLRKDMSVGEAFNAAARNCLEQIRANEAVVLLDRSSAPSPEAIHQLRVGVRRLRALVTVFKSVLPERDTTFLRPELAWLQGALGPAREWDVFVLETLTPLRRRLPRVPGLIALEKAAQEHRELAGKAARAALLTARYTDLLLRFEFSLGSEDWAFRRGGSRAAKQRIGPFAAEALERRADKVHKLTRKWKTLPEAELHDVRILVKKLRYTVEFFQALYPNKMVKRQLQALSRIQNTLGWLNDAVVTEDLLTKFGGTLPEHDVALIKGWQAASIERDLVHFRDDLKAYEKSRVPWT